MTARDRSATLAKGLAVLACFQSGARDLTMADVARQTGLDRAVARRLCLTLEAEGLLTRSGKFLRLTPKVLALAGGYLSAEGIGQRVQPVLNQCAEDLHGEIALAVLEGENALYVARSAVGSARLSFGFSVGSTLPLAPTAVGRMLLAGWSAQQRAALITRVPPHAYTTRTELDPARILASCAQAEAAGFSYVSGEFEAQAAGLAVPATALSGAPAALSTSAPIAVLENPERRAHMLECLLRAARLL